MTFDPIIWDPDMTNPDAPPKPITWVFDSDGHVMLVEGHFTGPVQLTMPDGRRVTAYPREDSE